MKAYSNGNMLIEAKKSMAVIRSQRDVILGGIVRPEDIDSTNTVTSDRIANPEVFIDGKAIALLMLLFSYSLATCVDDEASIKSGRNNYLVGYGLVVCPGTVPPHRPEL